MSYLQNTRHPAPCLFFILPLLFAYEASVVSLSDSQGTSLRNGADVMLRSALASVGFSGPSAPFLIVSILVIWAWRRRKDPPEDTPSVLMGMVLESVAIALLLWALSRFYGPILDSLGIKLTVPGTVATHLKEGDKGGLASITFLGAGIYEEVVFRLVLFSGLSLALRFALLPGMLADVLAAGIAAGAFAAVHHVGPNGESMDGFVFVFRVIAGLYFTLVYRLRGLGVAVGAHACYDVLVGVAM